MKRRSSGKPIVISETDLGGSWTVEIDGKRMKNANSLEEIRELFGTHPVHCIKGRWIIHKRET